MVHLFSTYDNIERGIHIRMSDLEVVLFSEPELCNRVGLRFVTDAGVTSSITPFLEIDLRNMW